MKKEQNKIQKQRPKHDRYTQVNDHLLFILEKFFSKKRAYRLRNKRCDERNAGKAEPLFDAHEAPRRPCEHLAFMVFIDPALIGIHPLEQGGAQVGEDNVAGDAARTRYNKNFDEAGFEHKERHRHTDLNKEKGAEKKDRQDTGEFFHCLIRQI